MSPLKRRIRCSVLHNSTATIPEANKCWTHTVCQAHIMWFHLMHGLQLPVTSFCSHYDSPLRMRSGPQGMDTAQKAQSNHRLCSRPGGNTLLHYESECKWAQFKWSLAQLLHRKAKQEKFKRSLAERSRRATGGNWPSHFLPELSHHSTPLLFFCFVYQ